MQEYLCSLHKGVSRKKKGTKMEQLVIKNILKLYDNGFKIVPAPYKSKNPVLSKWQDKYFRTREDLTNYLNRVAKSNFVIVPNDDVIVFDVDNRNGGMESFEKLKHLFAPTFKVVTGSGGYHYYYRLPKGFNKILRKNLDDAGYTGIDVKNKRGCLVAPGSIHPNGGIYKIAEDSIDTLADVPQELLKLAVKEFENIKLYQHNSKVKIIKGNRNNYITSYVGHLFKIGNNYKSVLLLAQNKNKEVCKPPLPNKEVAAIVKSISRYDNANTGYSCGDDNTSEEVNIASKIRGILSNSKIKNIEKQYLVGKIIIDKFEKSGKFYKANDNFYYFYDKIHKLISINRDNIWFKTLLSCYGINAANDIYKIVYEALLTHCNINGEETTVYKYAHYDNENYLIYLKNGNNMLKISDNTVEVCNNGKDGVLFTDTIKVAAYKYIENIDKDYLGDYLINIPNYVDTAYLTQDDFRLITSIYLHSMFMPEFMGSKPIIATVGQQGSGKTTLLRMMLKCLYSPSAEVVSLANNISDMDNSVTKKHFFAIDNLDTYNEKVNDKLAGYATGISNEKRKLYTDGGVFCEDVDAFIGLSTRNPIFKRPDVAQRVIAIHLDTHHLCATQRNLIYPIIKYRPQILSQIINKMKGILAIAKSGKYEDDINSFRMSDFATFTKMYLNDDEKAEALLYKLKKSQQSVMLEDDILMVYLAKYLNYQIKNNIQPEWLTARDLYKWLDGTAASEVVDTCFKNEFRSKYENAVSLGRRLNSIKNEIMDYVHIEIKNRGGNMKAYRLSPAGKFQEWDVLDKG